jgi:hypothetical protein
VSSNFQISLSPDGGTEYRYPMLYEFLLRRNMLICTCFSPYKLHFHYNGQLVFVRRFIAKAEKFICSTLGGGDSIYLHPRTSPTFLVCLHAWRLPGTTEKRHRLNELARCISLVAMCVCMCRNYRCGSVLRKDLEVYDSSSAASPVGACSKDE